MGNVVQASRPGSGNKVGGGQPLVITVKTSDNNIDYTMGQLVIDSGTSHRHSEYSKEGATSKPTSHSNMEGYVGKSMYGSFLEDQNDTDVMAAVRREIIGRKASFTSPFGPRYIVYCDFVASAKPIRYIEDFINREVLPYYANTHTTTSYGAVHTATLREEARSIILQAVRGNEEEDVVIFTGSGTTSAVHKLIGVLKLADTKTAVFISAFEHHSNLLPWRTLGLQMVRIKETVEGEVDVADLKFQMKRYKSRGYNLISSMSAASNVTGILVDTDKITQVVHSMGGLAFWDYACAGPYMQMDMNPGPNTKKDAIFLSPHKFLGGVGTPGVLITKRALFTNDIPDKVGGGTVTFVNKTSQFFTMNIAEREEGGTPAIVESIRAGLTFQLKENIGVEKIEDQEEHLTQRAFEGWRHVDNLFLLGGHTAKRLPIFSFLIGHPPSGKFLHPNFVAVLLNDLYGIQARGGCACAGPYVMDLLCVNERDMQVVIPYLEEIPDKNGKVPLRSDIMKPGFTRLNLAYFMDEETVQYVINAVARVASEGWKLLPMYKFDSVAGSWIHREAPDKDIPSIQDVSLKGWMPGRTKTRSGPTKDDTEKSEKPEPIPSMRDTSILAEKMFSNAESRIKEMALNLRHEKVKVRPDDEKLIWFLEPRVAQLYLLSPGSNHSKARTQLPFLVRSNTLIHSSQDELKNNMLDMGFKLEKDAGHPMFIAPYLGEDSS